MKCEVFCYGWWEWAESLIQGMGWCSLFYIGISSFSSTGYWKGSPFSLICLCTFVEYQLTMYLLFPTGLREWLTLRQLLHCPCSDLQIVECFFPLGRDCSAVRNRGTGPTDTWGSGHILRTLVTKLIPAFLWWEDPGSSPLLSADFILNPLVYSLVSTWS